MSILGAAIYAASVLGGCSPSGNATPSGTGGASVTGGASSGGTIASGGTTPVTGGSGGGGTVNTGGVGVSSGGSVATGGALTGGSSGAAAGGSSGAAAGGVSTGGAGGGAAGAGGSGGAVELKMPIERSGKYVLEFGNVLFEVDPAVGGRVVTFSLNGQNLLTNAAADNTKMGNYGSTFWPSPQMWGGSDWPPIPEVDSQAYAPSLDGSSIVVTQQSASARGKVSVKKRFTAVLNAQAVDVEYTLTNKDTAAASWAPWEISRVALSGLTFFPTGSSVVSIPTAKSPLPLARVTAAGGVSWYKSAPADRGKYSADGAEGWLAQVSGNLLFVKRFADVPAAQSAPGEGDAEFYAGDGYEEIEAQGAYQSLQAGASLTWTVRWYVRQLSDPSIATVGNAALVTMARDVIKQ